MRAGLFQELRFVLRQLKGSPVFALVGVLSLTIGIGANLATYGVIRALLLDPLPVRAPEELSLVYWNEGGDVSISQMNSSGYRDAGGTSYRSNVSYPIYEDALALGGDDAELAGFMFLRNLSVAFDERPAVLVGGALADGGYFPLLDPPMTMGRGLDRSDDVPGASLTAVISHSLWTQVFARDPGVLGQTLRVNGVSAAIVGVTGEGFGGLSKGGFFPTADVTLPLRSVASVLPQSRPAEGTFLTSEELFWLRLVVRLRGDAPTTAFDARLAAVIAGRIGPMMTAVERPPSVLRRDASRGLDQTGAETRRLLFVLLGVAGVVLLLACINLANLMLARGAARQREFAVRRALGASRIRLVGQVVLEGLCLACAGGLGGIALTWLGRRGLTNMFTAGLGTAPLSMQPLEVFVDARLVAWTMGLALVAGVLCSIVPAIRLTRVSPGEHLKHRSVGGASRKLTLSRGLIAVQIAVSLPLLVGAVAFLQTLSNLGRVDLGFNPDGVAFFKIDPAATGRPESEHVAVYREVLDRVRGVPGVSSATLIENVFLSGIVSNNGITVDGERISLYMNAVGPDFQQTMGVWLEAGRLPDENDGPGAPRVAAINRAAAERLFPGRSPVGEVLDVGGLDVEIVGLVADTVYDRQRSGVRPTVFPSAFQRGGYGGHTVVMRTSVPVEQLEPKIREAVSLVSRELPVPPLATQQEQIRRSLVRERVLTQVLTSLGGFALLLASIGLYGVTSYSVARRRNEIGVRMALGARPVQVLWMILRQVAILAAAGLVLGVPLALTTAPMVGSLLFGVEPTDVVLLATAALIMTGVAALAGVVPARRAARLDPLVALRRD